MKYGGATGAVFAGLAYAVTYQLGFNDTSFAVLMYLYLILGFISRLSLEDFTGSMDVLERFVIVAEEEELKLKKIFTGEEYKIDGTVKKV